MEYSEKDNQRRQEIAECVLGLFDIMTNDSKMVFVDALRPMGNGTIGDIVRGATFIQLARMIRKVGEAKFTQDPKPLLERMSQVTTPSKEEREDLERRKETFVNSLFPPIFQGGPAMDKPWIKATNRLPDHCKLVFVATFDVKDEDFQYYVGWYDENKKEWYLDDNGYTEDVSFWMPIPELKVSDL